MSHYLPLDVRVSRLEMALAEAWRHLEDKPEHAPAWRAIAAEVRPVPVPKVKVRSSAKAPKRSKRPRA
jgi:hypothetical protein